MHKKEYSSLLEKMDKTELVDLVESLLWQYRVIDAFWFLNVEKQYGLESAESINTTVWNKVGQLAARDIVKRFGIQEKGLAGFEKAMRYYSWKLMDCFDLEHRDGELIATSSNCPAQMGRLKHGLGEYACRDMHFHEFDSFAKEIDPDIVTECVFAPPDPHPEDLFCKWRIYIP